MEGLPMRAKVCFENEGVFVTVDGLRIAQRGFPGTPQAKTWIPLEPGYAVYDNVDLTGMVIEYNGVRLQ
jgi:hypothetical protein